MFFLMMQRQAKERTACIGIPEWSPLTRHVWMEQEPFRTRRHIFRNTSEHFIRINAKSFRGLYLGSRKLVPYPAKNNTAIVHGPANDPCILC
ncbi:hypothetical protein D3C74_365640 [compost metagenome]